VIDDFVDIASNLNGRCEEETGKGDAGQTADEQNDNANDEFFQVQHDLFPVIQFSTSEGTVFMA
jgi:hypothetical protein